MEPNLKQGGQSKCGTELCLCYMQPKEACLLREGNTVSTQSAVDHLPMPPTWGFQAIYHGCFVMYFLCIFTLGQMVIAQGNVFA